MTRRSIAASVALSCVFVGCGSPTLDDFAGKWRAPNSTHAPPDGGRTARERAFEGILDRDLLLGKRAAQVRDALGAPARVDREGGTNETWHYLVRAGTNGRCVKEALVSIGDGEVTGLVNGSQC